MTLSAILTHWSFEPSVVAGLVALGAGYVWLLRRPGMAVPAGRRAGFWLAIVLLALALLSPLDELSDVYLLSAHMIQHLLLVLIVAPLIVRAIPYPLARQLNVHPLAAFFGFNFIFALSHLPIWYEATLQHEWLHVIEHLLYIGAGVVNWLPVLNPAKERRLNSGLSMLYLFAETLPMLLVGSIMSLSSIELYPWYLRAPHIGPLAPLQDQSVAGLIMWIGGSFFYLAALTVVFFRWANQEIGMDELEQENRVGEPPAMRTTRQGMLAFRREITSIR